SWTVSMPWAWADSRALWHPPAMEVWAPKRGIKVSGARSPALTLVPSFTLVPKLCLGTHLRETPVSRSRRHFDAVRETEFRGMAFPNRVWERGSGTRLRASPGTGCIAPRICYDLHTGK